MVHGYQLNFKEDQHQTRGPSIRGLVQPHPCPDDGVDDVFRKFVCIYLILFFLFQIYHAICY